MIMHDGQQEHWQQFNRLENFPTLIFVKNKKHGMSWLNHSDDVQKYRCSEAS